MADAPDRLVSALSRRYRIEVAAEGRLRLLGAGGMATVYLAHDLKHDRTVAIKVLREDVAQTLGAERFLREIQLAAKLNHPHILPLFDSGEADGLLYFVMPNVEGASLRDRLDRSKPLPVEEAVRVASEVAGALDYAHRHQVVHRDIKPENIMLHEGHALVADFGIGKALSAVERETFTQTGMSVGTPAYMSPEQAAGDAVDGRSDLYSLGCVLYEMLVGEQPFTGATVQAVIAKRFVQTPADVTALRDGVPRPVARAVQKALARLPIDRFETGAQFAGSLSEVETPAAAASPENSLAVLPFTSLSQNPEDAFFADGITEEILNALAAIPGLRVAGRSSAFSFKGRSEGPRSIGAKLNVATILEGTMRRSGNRLRITVQLISAADGYQLWSERYDRVLEDVFAVQDEIATAIAGRLRVSLGAERVGQAAKPPTKDLAAYELYLKGRALLYQRGRSIPGALDCFRRAVALDPEYAQAWAGMADGYTTSCYSSFSRPAAVMPLALEAARRALALDPDLAEAHCALAEAAMLYERDYALAGREFRQAIALNPSYPQARAWFGFHYLFIACRRLEEAEQQLGALLEIDPLSGYAHAVLGQLRWTSGRAEEGLPHLRRALEIDPDSYLSQWSLATALLFAGRPAEAMAEGERALAMSGRHLWTLATLACACAALGKPEEARMCYQEILVRSGREYMQPGMVAIAAIGAGELEQAVALARQALDERDPLLVIVARAFPFFDALRPDPRFEEILAAIGYPG